MPDDGAWDMAYLLAPRQPLAVAVKAAKQQPHGLWGCALQEVLLFQLPLRWRKVVPQKNEGALLLPLEVLFVDAQLLGDV
eukprot:CAMPEP_0117688922 /NCGR_PEP_ID=MMETSP0804-20121206/24146_1 /TAXON_ID=1074897 /ORGANISM="Tetraselmis astigmatica, Strain CCMP880" /LENGTH=79 /DNA_ID=CAMNT_0005501523 /DNA_START=240 /DNA_END=479 /DNA_ORIENTATION=+